MMSRVRALFTFAGGSGHSEPLVPVADAARTAGHAVAFAGRASVVAELATRGFAAFPDSADPADAPGTIAPLLEVSAEREDGVLRDAFAGRVARRRAASVVALCDEWSPDVIVCDEVDFGAMVAAERAGLPHATVLVTAAGSFVRPEVVAEPLSALRAEHRLPSDPDVDMQSRHLARHRVQRRVR
jgi:UDP:flavonoid glycosyltransferase YjiC (YdhE family)